MGRPKKNLNAINSEITLKKIPNLAKTFDINTQKDAHWESVLKKFNKMARIYGYSRIETPIFEDARLYKSFYSFLNADKTRDLINLLWSGENICLRPSQLPGIFRHYIQQKLFETPEIYKWHYSGYVSHKDKDEEDMNYEFGCEVLGPSNTLNQAQVILSAWEFLNSLGLEELVFEINNLGNYESQMQYSTALLDWVSQKKYELCEDCIQKLDIRPLGILSCGNLDCQTVISESPTILDFLDETSHKEFTSLLEALDEIGIVYQLNPLFACRQHADKINFAIKSKVKDKMSTLIEGGGHSMVLSAISGKPLQSFGFFGNLNFLSEVVKGIDQEPKIHSQIEVCLVPLGELASKKSLRLFKDLTAQKILVYDLFGSTGVKNQLKLAQERKVPIALIIGQKEAVDEMVILRDVKSGMQEIISYDKIIEEVKKRLGK